MNGSRIRDGLDRLGIPWRTPKAELKARNGALGWPDETWQIVPVESNLPSLLAPLSFRDEGHSPTMPPAYISGYFWASDDAEGNLAAARAVFEPVFGKPGDGRGMSSNIISWVWGTRPATVKITVWPRHLNKDRGRNTIHDAEPRTRDACSIEIRSGFRPPCSPEELEWLERIELFNTAQNVPESPAEESRREGETLFGKVCSLLFGKPRFSGLYDQPVRPRVNGDSPSDRMLDFQREAPAGYIDRYYGKVGLSPGREAFISCTETLLIVPTAQIAAIEIVTITPGRSFPSGGVDYNILCRLPYALDRQERLGIDLPHTDLETLAARLGVRIEEREEWGD